MAIPYALKVLENPMRDVNSRYSLLCQSLGMQGWQRLKVVELRALKRPLARALAFACVLSIGDFGVVALFGNEDFRTLPFWLYQQIGSYRGRRRHGATPVAAVLCVIYRYRKLPGRDVKLTDVTRFMSTCQCVLPSPFVRRANRSAYQRAGKVPCSI